MKNKLVIEKFEHLNIYEVFIFLNLLNIHKVTHCNFSKRKSSHLLCISQYPLTKSIEKSLYTVLKRFIHLQVI